MLLVSIVADDEKYDTEIRRGVRIGWEDFFRKDSRYERIEN